MPQGEGVEMAQEPARVAELKRQLGRRLADLRRAAQVTQQELARHTFVDRSYVSHAERGISTPERAFWIAADAYLNAGSRLAAAYDELAAARPAVRQAELDTLRTRHLSPTDPIDYNAEALRHELAAAFGTTMAGPGSAAPPQPDLSSTAAHTVQVMEAFSGHDLVSRRQALQQLSVLSGATLLRPIRQWIALLPVVPVNGSRAIDELSELENAVKLFRRWDASGVGGLKRKAVIGQLNAVTEAIRDATGTALRQRLFQITAELAQLAGWMSYDQGLTGAAQRYYLLALHASREAGAPDLAAKVIGDMMQLSTSLGNYDDSVQLARAGIYALPCSEASPVHAELLGLEACAFAELGRPASAVRSIETCLSVWEDRAGDPMPDWLHYFNQSEVECLAANAYTQLAMSAENQRTWLSFAARAEQHALGARSTRSSGYDRSRILDELRLANVRLAQREPCEAMSIATRVLHGERARSAIVCKWLARLRDQLVDRYPDVVGMKEFGDQLSERLS
jgi:transcriptional regulator with XRE-family HTH domain